MESENINSPLPENDELDAQCRAHFSAPAIPDAGFSNRVLAALPATTNRALNRQRRLFCGIGLIAGVAVTAPGLIGSSNTTRILAQLASGVTAAAVQFFSGPVMLALSLAAFSLWFAFRDRWRLRPRL